MSANVSRETDWARYRLGGGVAVAVTLLATGVASQDVPAGAAPARCVTVSHSADALSDLDEVVSEELRNRGIVVRSAESSCVAVRVETLAEDAAVVEVEGQRARVVELGAVSPQLRSRALALAVAEEVRGLWVDAPELRATPNPREPSEPAVERSSFDVEADLVAAAEPSDNEADVALVIGAGGEHATSVGQTFAVVTAAFDVPMGSSGSLRIGVVGGYGTHDTAFGDTNTWWLGATGMWRWVPVGDATWQFALVPGLTLAAAHLSATPGLSIGDNGRDVTRILFQLTLEAQVALQVARGFWVELGPTVALTPNPPEVRGDGSAIAGVSLFDVGGRLALRIEL